MDVHLPHWRPGAPIPRTPLLCDSPTTVRPRRRRRTVLRREEAFGRQRLCCASCGGFVAERDAGFSVNGSHRHLGTNPHGLTFEIGCFRTAPGCYQVGEETVEWSWFPGYRWRVALCRACGMHLGWCYRGGEPAFYGLILDQLRSCNEESL